MIIVAPFTGAWIEITCSKSRWRTCGVAPFTGAWIEITTPTPVACPSTSLPSRERGLKSA